MASWEVSDGKSRLYGYSVHLPFTKWKAYSLYNADGTERLAVLVVKCADLKQILTTRDDDH